MICNQIAVVVPEVVAETLSPVLQPWQEIPPENGPERKGGAEGQGNMSQGLMESFKPLDPPVPETHNCSLHCLVI